MLKDVRVAARQERIQHSHQPLPPSQLASDDHVSAEASGQRVEASLASPQLAASSATDILSLIGNTPLLRMQRIGVEHRGVELYAKAEWANPGGSVKDRPALNIILEAERAGVRYPGPNLIDLP